MSTSYGTVTTADGWVGTNCAVQSGGEKDQNPVFTFIGGSDVRALVMNGKVSAPGSITSPTLTGGIKKLTFNYGFAFANEVCKFTVNIKQGGSVVATKTVELNKEDITQYTAYTFSMDVTGVSGDFTIELVNDCFSGASANKDRVSIFNLAWEN